MIGDVLIDVKIASSMAGQCLKGAASSICITSQPHDTDASTDVRLESKVSPSIISKLSPVSVSSVFATTVIFDVKLV